MAVYVDQAIWRWAERSWCHLLADDVEELHRFASMIGVHRLLYQGPPKTSAPHYDITGLERDRAIRMGAIACGREEIVAVFRRVRVKNGKIHRKALQTPIVTAAEAPVAGTASMRRGA
jgi:hypothetical protein